MKAKLIDWIYPVGSVVASVNASFDPNKIYNGTWERFAKGQTLVGVNESDADFAAGKSGGEKKHTLTTAELAAHAHATEKAGYKFVVNNQTAATNGMFQTDASGNRWTDAQEEKSTFAHVGNTGSSGSGTAHNNLQPYTTAYYWKRTK